MKESAGRLGASSASAQLVRAFKAQRGLRSAPSCKAGVVGGAGKRSDWFSKAQISVRWRLGVHAKGAGRGLEGRGRAKRGVIPMGLGEGNWRASRRKHHDSQNKMQAKSLTHGLLTMSCGGEQAVPAQPAESKRGDYPQEAMR